jgi:hypothetical protein
MIIIVIIMTVIVISSSSLCMLPSEGRHFVNGAPLQPAPTVPLLSYHTLSLCQRTARYLHRVVEKVPDRKKTRGPLEPSANLSLIARTQNQGQLAQSARIKTLVLEKSRHYTLGARVRHLFRQTVPPSALVVASVAWRCAASAAAHDSRRSRVLKSKRKHEAH